MSEINVFGCTSCNTLWDDVDLGDDGKCAACWRKEADRLLAERDEARQAARRLVTVLANGDNADQTF